MPLLGLGCGERGFLKDPSGFFRIFPDFSGFSGILLDSLIIFWIVRVLNGFERHNWHQI